MFSLGVIIAMNKNPKKYSKGLGMSIHNPYRVASQAKISGDLNSGTGCLKKQKHKKINKNK